MPDSGSDSGGGGKPVVRLSFEDPFAAPASERRLDRRLRGRLVAPVTIWTAASAEPGGRPERAGLTISSLLVAEGDPAAILAVVDPLSELHELAQSSGQLVVHVLGGGDEPLARLFAGAYPVDPFDEVAWAPDDFGPVLEGDRHVIRCRFSGSETSGFQALVRAEIVSAELSPAATEPLAWYHGSYRTLA